MNGRKRFNKGDWKESPENQEGEQKHNLKIPKEVRVLQEKEKSTVSNIAVVGNLKNGSE